MMNAVAQDLYSMEMKKNLTLKVAIAL